MHNQNSILTDAELVAVAGGSAVLHFHAMAAGAVSGGTGGGGSHFPIGPTTGTAGGKPCNNNHNGVIYPM